MKNRQEKNDTYHGYGIQNFLEVDKRFGTTEDLQELVRQAHARGMYVILDIIIDHTGDNWAYPGDYAYYYWEEASGPFDPVFGVRLIRRRDFRKMTLSGPGNFNIRNAIKEGGGLGIGTIPDEAINGDFLSLKELDITQPKVLDALIKVYKYWISIADVDGFRVDTAKHMESSATAIFCCWQFRGGRERLVY